MPIQNALKLPATRPDRMLSDGPPSRDATTISLTCAELVDVKTLTISGIAAPAKVPQEIIAASFHQSVPSPSVGISACETMNVRIIDTIDVSQTSEVSGVSKSRTSDADHFARATALFTAYEPTLEITIMIRIAKIQTSSWT